MKKLIKVITDYSRKNIDELNNWYSWREINEDKLPLGIKLPRGNQYIKNLSLKKQLNKCWREAQDNRVRGKLIEYYISTWGGIHTNSKESIIEYSTISAAQLIKFGKKGIASWSKAIVIHDPEEYAIFDARVAISINCIQKLFNLNEPMLFPILPSRNKKVALGNKLIKQTAKIESWGKTYDETFYKQYIDILKSAANELSSDISTIEMLLFAKAEEFVDKTFPNKL